MTESLKVALAQLNPKVGDVGGNLAKVRAARAEARKQGAELVLTSALVLFGYPPEDLAKPAFQKCCNEAVEALRADTRDGGPALFVATPWCDGDKTHKDVDAGDLVALRRDRHLGDNHIGVRDVAEQVSALHQEMMMVRGVGVEIGYPSVDRNSTQQPSLRELT
jgi:predicted amidohydrolase